MKSPALYLLEVFFCSGMLLAFYRLLLVRKVSFAACRRYLVAAMLLSAAIPALDIPLYPARTEADPLPLVASQAVPPAEEPFVAEAGPAGRRCAHNGPCHRLGTRGTHRRGRIVPADRRGVACDPCRAHPRDQTSAPPFADHRLRRHMPRRRILASGRPFSFLRTVFLGEGYEGRRREIVVCHEASHVRHRHSAERIALELVRSVFWFNPFVWIARALAFGGAGVGGRPRRARCGVRPHGIQDDHFPSTLRL